ncbi:MAG TPA: hypothetical protein VHB21_02435 [Minicystis sp.]|nr:hypothetical protein [Minicystis sp.]
MSRTAEARPARASAFFSLLAIAASFTFAGCPCISGPVNASPELRWFLFSNFGASKVCPEILKQGVPIRLEQRAPAMGRFFPQQCTYQVDDQRQTMTVNLSGTGYGYVLPAKRVGFSLTVSVEYRPDFQIAGDDVYVWARMNRIVQGPQFQTGYVENPVVNVLSNIPPFGSLADFFGKQVVTAAMTQGFTVIHNDDGNDFALGVLFPPAKPHHPFQVTSAERYTFANETVDVHEGERDYLGPFEIAKKDQALFLMLSLQGPPVDVMIVDKQTGDAWREAYQTGKPLGPPPGPVVAGAPLYAGPTDSRTYKLPPGQYYVVVDNTSAAGSVSPPASIVPFSDALARLSYVAQLAD